MEVCGQAKGSRHGEGDWGEGTLIVLFLGLLFSFLTFFSCAAGRAYLPQSTCYSWPALPFLPILLRW